MCGIFGVLLRDKNAVVDPHALNRTRQLLGHRGPDCHGIHTQPGLGLVHTRLSLVDVSARSNQPFWDAEKRYCLVYNGEVYNFRELRGELESAGCQFRTTSDTEVVLCMLLHRGIEETLSRLEGMYAFAFLDSVEKSLVLVRDRLGIKPLYYSESDTQFLFASEIRALQPWIEFKPDMMSVSAYLHGFEGSNSKNTFFENIRTFPPGGVMTLRPGQEARVESYFHVSDLWNPEESEKLQRASSREIVDQFDERFCASVRSQLFADAPVGAYCSGGVDSSLILAIAARINPDLTIFHANVVGTCSEYEAAKELSRHFKLELKSVDVEDRYFLDMIPDVIEHYGYPFIYHDNSIPFLAVSRLVHQWGVKGVLSGEGSDECYLGYPWLIPKLRKNFARLPSTLWCRLTGQVRRLIKGPRPAVSFKQPRDNFASLLESRFERDLDAEKIANVFGGLHEGEVDARNVDTLRQLTYHLRTLLHRNDSLGMAASVEARFPFLDSQLVRFAVNLPYRYKIRMSSNPFDAARTRACYTDKWIVRKVADRYLPRQLSRRPKQGFSVNTYHRFNVRESHFKNSFVADALHLSVAEIDFLFRHASRHFKRRLVHLNVWASLYLEGRDLESVRQRLRQDVTIAPHLAHASVIA